MYRQFALTVTLAGVVFGSAAPGAANKEASRLENCGVGMQEVLDGPDKVPQELLEKRELRRVLPATTQYATARGGGSVRCFAGSG